MCYAYGVAEQKHTMYVLLWMFGRRDNFRASFSRLAWHLRRYTLFFF